MLKSKLKRIAAVVCAAAMCAQLAVMPTVSAKYIHEDQQGIVLEERTIFEGEQKKETTKDTLTKDSISFDLGELSGDIRVQYDFSLNGAVPPGSEKNTYDSCYMGPTCAKTGAVLGVTTVKDGQYAFLWKRDGIDRIDGSYTLGETYTIIWEFHGIGAAGSTADVTILDKDGNTMNAKTGLGLRNISGEGLTISGIDFCSTSEIADETAGWTVSNMKLKQTLPSGIVVTLGDGDAAVEPSDDYTKELDLANDTIVKVAASAQNNGVNVAAPAIVTEFTMADGSELPTGIEYKEVTQGKNTFMALVFSADLAGADAEGGKKEYPISIKASLKGYEQESVTYSTVFTKGYVTDEILINALSKTVVMKNAEGKELKADKDGNITISDNVSFMEGNKKVSLTWTVENEKGEIDTSVINPATGVVTPPAEDTKFVVKATAAAANPSSTAAPQVTTFNVIVKGVQTVVDAAVDAIALTSADDSTKMVDLTKLAEDVKLPDKSSTSPYININWATNNTTNLPIQNNTAQVYLSKPGAVDAELTATVSYVKNGVTCASATKKYPVKVDVDENAAGKYTVRCDMLANNFGTMPEKGDIVTDDIDLPEKGVFGSTISWSSSVPRAISNKGIVTRQSSRQTVTLTATIQKDNASDKVKFEEIIVPAKSTSGNSGGSSGGSGGSGGNRGDTKLTFTTTPISTPVIATPTPQQQAQQPQTVTGFTDLGSVAWAQKAINAMRDKGIIAGRSDTEFAPNDNITRAEFAKIIISAFGLEDANASAANFSDVDVNAWYYPYVAAAYNKGIITGYYNDFFGVNDNITRQDMAVIIYRAAQKAGKSIDEINAAIDFADAGSIADYAKEAVTALQKGGVINGVSATEFAPTATATRAQAAQMIYGLIK